MQLRWHGYRYYPYERQLALREIETLLEPAKIRQCENGIEIAGPKYPKAAHRLVYFAASVDGSTRTHTQQALLERVNGNGANRQSTRYSAHGLHEYKGRFNPQVAKAILNILGAVPGDRALDPFCGSGTSLVECAHLGISAVGTDLNPLAVFLANAKIGALCVPASRIVAAAKTASANARALGYKPSDDERSRYLAAWFDPVVLRDIERLRIAINRTRSDVRPVLLAVGSNLLRDYSLQEPHDLRIRRRKSPMPDVPLLTAFRMAMESFGGRLEDAQKTLARSKYSSRALLLDCREIDSAAELNGIKFDLALTSPPYATALPYIDTQRLSLVWLGLIPASRILSLEAELIGSREIRGSARKLLIDALQSNQANLPNQEANLCLQLQTALKANDGFRRRAVPVLLYRYFAGMGEAFRAIRSRLKRHAPFALIVGGNHTVLGGRRFDIDTPKHLASIAVSHGWSHVETIGLQTYQRYGLHMNNATTSEALLILRS